MGIFSKDNSDASEKDQNKGITLTYYLNKIDKVYIVECHSGDFDSYTTWIAGVYTTNEAASELSNRLNTEAKVIKDNCPVKYSDDLSDEDDEIYWNYHVKYQKAMEFGEAEVREIILNKEIKKLWVS